MKRLLGAVLFGGAILGAASAQTATAGGERGLSREEAVARARGDDPGLMAAGEAVRAAEATARQAALRPNPSLDVQLEDFGGTGPLSGTDGAQATYALSQSFELGGDRRARRRHADSVSSAARVRQSLSERDLQEAVELAFIEAQAAQAGRAVAQDHLSTAKKFAAAVEDRVRAARDPLAAASRIAARLAEAEIASDAAEARARAADAALASFWGGETAEVEMMTFYEPMLRTGSAGTTPEIALAEAERDSAEAKIAIERARRVPDPELRAGFRQLRETDSSAFVVGVSVPLPIWNRNGGAIAAARADHARAEYEVEAKRRALGREIGFLAAEAEAARLEADTYATRVIPKSEEALAQTLRVFQQGGLSYVEALDAQRSLNEARERQVAALLAFHRAEIRLARLRGSADIQETKP